MNKPSHPRAPLRLQTCTSYKGLPLGRVLMDRGLVTPRDMAETLAEGAVTHVPLDRLMRSKALVSGADMLDSRALAAGKMRLDRASRPPDPTLSQLLSPAFCLEHSVLPWMRIGDAVLVATSRPSQIPALAEILRARIGKVHVALAAEEEIQAVVAERHALDLVDLAETQVPAAESCRDINKMTPFRALLASLFFGLCIAALVLQPRIFFLTVVLVAIVNLLATQGLKIAAFLYGRKKPLPAPAAVDLPEKPVVSMLVPLYREKDIARALVERLSRLTYPKALLDVVLALEASDAQTRAALDDISLPPWMRVVEIPDGSIRTKPRALNYALRFARGDIVGIWDAEDAPATDQIDRVVEHFQRAKPDVACLQGILDYYNPQANWLSRCFTIEYATWFRVILPGAARMGFAIPLGGTTLFLRRSAIEQVRGWDAHNVTEDADLGIRLARHGYRTEIINTVTREEANNRVLPWIRQRSRWLKGYMITWRVHMRRPLRLLRELGPWKFFGFQLFFLTAILQFLLAPALWSFWVVVFGFDHPFTDILPEGWIGGLVALFLLTEAISLLIGYVAVARSQHDNLLVWVPTMLLYFPLGVAAAYKALAEVSVAPFYWDKTHHGVSPPDRLGSDIHVTRR